MPLKDPDARRAYHREAARKWRAANRERHRKYMRAWAVANDRAAYMRVWRSANSKSAYSSHKSSAEVRGIPFLLTFDEWMSIWLASGKWDERGRYAGQYCMARFGDVGPYSTDNVRIAPNQDNYRERAHTQSKESRQRQADALRGRPLSSEHREKILKAKLGKPKSAETRQKLREAAKAQWVRHRGSLPT